MTWSNWSREQACVPARRASPASAREVGAEVVRAREHGHGLRVAGAGHSFTDAVLTSGTLLSLDAMDRLIDVDRATGRVRVQAGMRLHALSAALAGHGLALENMGDVNVQSVAGAIATGTHGTGARLRNLSAQVEALQLVDGDGAVRELDGGDALRAARVSVGALGVVTEVTLRCVPAFTLRGVDAPRPLEDVLGSLDVLADGTRHFEFFVFPWTELALTRTNTLVDEAPRPEPGWRRWVDEVALGNGLFGAVCAVGRRVPALIPALNRAIAGAFSPKVRVDRSDRVFASKRYVRFTEMELAVPRASAAAFVRAVLGTARRFPVVFPIEVRFVAADDAMLSPATGRDTCYVAVHNVRGAPWEAYFREVQALGDEHGARPHWGKRHFHDAASLAPRYPDWAAFGEQRRRFDPGGVFANAYVRRVLGA